MFIKRSVLGYSLLFAGSMAASLAWLHHDHGTAAGSASAAALAPALASVDSRAAGASASSATGESTDTDQTSAAAQMRSLAQRSLTATNADEVLEAVRGMDVARTPESLAALSHLMGEYPDGRVRLAAITTLGQLATQVGDRDGRIREILRSTGSASDTQTLEFADQTVTQLNSLAAPGG